MLTNRQQRLLAILLQRQVEGYCRGAELAEALGVSTKTIQQEVKALRRELEGRSVSLESVSNRGYRLLGLDDGKRAALTALLRDDANETDDSTPIDIIALLLGTQGYLRVTELAERLYLSESKISKDMRRVREILARYGLELEHKPYHGLCIAGNELDKRRLILESGLLNAMPFESNEERLRTTNSLMDIVLRTLSSERYLASDAVIETLVSYLYVAVQRVGRGFRMRYDFAPDHEHDERLYQVSQCIATCVRDEMDVYLPYSEIRHLCMYLQAGEQVGKEIRETEDVGQIAEGMLGYVAERLGFDFRGNHELVTSLALHLKPMLLRARNGFPLKNPIFDDIVASYPLAYDAALSAAQYLFGYHNVRISADEASYLAAYFAVALEDYGRDKEPSKKRVLVISSQRHGNTLLMRKMFSARFGDQISQLDVVNLVDLESVDLASYDAVFTTALDYDIVSRDIPRINYFITGEDYEVISDALQGARKLRRFEDFFPEELVMLHVDTAGKEGLLAAMVHMAVDHQPILDANELLTSVQVREESGFTYFGRGVAIPHPEKMLDIPESFVVTATLQHGLEWRDNESATLVFLICVAEDDQTNLQRFYRGLSEVVTDEQLQRQLTTCTSYDAFALRIAEIGRRLA